MLSKMYLSKMHRQFFEKISQNKEYVDNFCNDMEIHLLLHVEDG